MSGADLFEISENRGKRGSAYIGKRHYATRRRIAETYLV